MCLHLLNWCPKIVSNFCKILSEVICTVESSGGDEGGQQGSDAICRAALLRVGVLAITEHMPFLQILFLIKQKLAPGQLDVLNIPYTAEDCKLVQLFCETILAFVVQES